MICSEFRIGKRSIGHGHTPYVIAEAGSNFNQSLDIAHRLIDVAREAGADAVKFQLFRADALYPVETEMHQLFKSIELNADWVGVLSDYARQNDIEFLASAFDRQSVDVLESVGVKAHKVASSETTNVPLLSYMAEKGKPLLISTGMCDLIDVINAVNICVGRNNQELALLQCGSMYPLPVELANLRVMDRFRAIFEGVVGFSDHTLGNVAAAAAVARNASVIEKHFTLDKTMNGPDHSYALEPNELKEYVRVVREAYAVLGDGTKDMLPQEREVGRREGLYAARDIMPGKRITEQDLLVRRPAIGLRARDKQVVIGATVTRVLAKNAPVSWEAITFSGEVE